MKKHKNIGKNLKIIGKVKRKNYKIFPEQISKIQEQRELKKVSIEVLWRERIEKNSIKWAMRSEKL